MVAPFSLKVDLDGSTKFHGEFRHGPMTGLEIERQKQKTTISSPKNPKRFDNHDINAVIVQQSTMPKRTFYCNSSVLDRMVVSLVI